MGHFRKHTDHDSPLFFFSFLQVEICGKGSQMQHGDIKKTDWRDGPESSSPDLWYQQQLCHVGPCRECIKLPTAWQRCRLKNTALSWWSSMQFKLVSLGVVHCSRRMVLETHEIKKSDGCKCVQCKCIFPQFCVSPQFFLTGIFLANNICKDNTFPAGTGRYPPFWQPQFHSHAQRGGGGGGGRLF